MCVCISWNIFNRIHFFAFCDVFDLLQLVRFLYDISYMIMWKVAEAASTNFFFIIYNLFTLLINCMKTVILAEQSLHHNIILEKLDHWWVNRICTKNVIPESHTLSLFSYRTRKLSMFLLIHFFTFSYFFFSFLSTSYSIWNWVNPFAYSFFHIQLFLFSCIHFHIVYEMSQSICLFGFSHPAISFFCLHFYILYEKSQPMCLVIFTHSAISFFLYFIFIFYMKFSEFVCLFIFNK
jgi:hypothetical protein